MISIYVLVDSGDKIPIKFPSKGGNLSQLLKAMNEKNINFPKKFQLIKDDEEIDKKENKLLNFIENETIILRDVTNYEYENIILFDIEDINNLIKIPHELIDNKSKIIDNKSKLIDNKSNPIPIWRIVFPGIKLWGECTNKECDANLHPVSYFVESKELNLIQNNMMKCPLCNIEIKCKNISFFNCYYNYYGEKIVKTRKELKKEKFGKRIENFDRINIPYNNIIMIDGEEYEIKKTEIGECDYYFDYNNYGITFTELIFQVREFK